MTRQTENLSVAVVMATYNGAKYVERQLRSIAEQDRLPDLLVISDDGSSDGTWDIATAYAQRFPFETKVVRGPSTGLADNFWHAAALAETDLIAWADQDDVWAPGKLRFCAAEMLDPRVGFVSHAAQTMDGDGRLLGRSYPDYRRRLVRLPLAGDPWHVPSGFASMFRRDLLGSIDFASRPRSHQTNRTMNHDHAVSLYAFATTTRVELPMPLAFYRQHELNSAGDPTLYGMSKLRAAFRSGAAEFGQLADVAAEQGEWLERTGGPPAARTFFSDLEDRCRARSRVYEAPHGLLRMRRIRQAASQSTYSSLDVGGFGRPALARDLLATWLLSGAG